MRLLLDTQALVWWLDGSTKLGARAREALEHPHGLVWISAVTAWEIVIKQALGRLKMTQPPEVALPKLFASGCEPLPITIDHALAVRTLPAHHRDPFDRMLVAQARVEDLTLVTSDEIFGQYDVQTLDARR